MLILNQIKKIVNKVLNRQSARNSDVIPFIDKFLSNEIISILDVGCGKLWDGNSKEEDILFFLSKKKIMK